LFFAIFPDLWMRLFTDEQEVIRIGTLYLRIVAPIYAVYGLGMALYFAMQGVGNLLSAVLSNAVRLLVSAGGALAAVSWFGAGSLGLFIAIGFGFLLYGALNAYVLLRTVDPQRVTPSARRRLSRSGDVGNRVSVREV
jgi:Na+-driven multidrug efflux pump